MRKNAKLQDLLLRSVGEGIGTVDLQGRATFINPAAARLLGWEAEALLGKHMHGLVHYKRADGTPYPEEECPICATFRDGKVHHVDEETFWKKDGTPLP